MKKEIDKIKDEQDIKDAEKALKEKGSISFDKVKEKLKKVFKVLKNVEIFRVGIWNGDEYTREDLQDIVNNFNILQDRLRPRLKLGHNDEQELLAAEGLPAAGFVTNVFLKGDVLFANFNNIPDKIFQLIESKQFNDVSVEIVWNMEDENTGEKFNRVLSAVALLGEDHPAVWDNSPLDMFLPGNLKAASKKGITEKPRVYRYSRDTNKESEMPDNTEDTKYVIAMLKEKDMSNKKEEKNELKELKAKLEASEKSNEEFKKTLAKKELEAVEKDVDLKIDAYMKEGKVLPSQMTYVKELFMDISQSKKTYSKDEKLSGSDLITKIFDLSPILVSLGESSRQTDTKEMDAHDKANAYMKEHKVEYKEALIAISEKNK